MARPIKPGLDYFPFDTDFSENAKVGAIMGEFGSKGVLTMVYLLSAVYKKGYYLQWNKLTEMQLVNKIDGLSSELANQIVTRLIDYGTFNKELFNSAKVLTSQDIQETYKEATKRRKSQKLSLYRINVNNNSTSEGVNDDINTQSKVNESKVNKTKSNNNHDDDNTFVPLFQMYQQEFGIMSPTAKQQLFDSVNDFTKGGATDQQASEIIQYAISIAVSYNKRYWNYTAKILDDWVNHSLFDLDNIKSYQNKPRKPKGSYKNFSHKPKEQATDWDKLKAKEPSDDSSNLQDRLKKLRDEENVTS